MRFEQSQRAEKVAKTQRHVLFSLFSSLSSRRLQLRALSGSSDTYVIMGTYSFCSIGSNLSFASKSDSAYDYIRAFMIRK